MTRHVATASRRAVASWAAWDWGSASFNAVIVTFVFSVYLTDAVGKDLSSPVSATTWLAASMAVAGVVIALTAPVMGSRSDGSSRRFHVSVWTAVTIALMVALFAVKMDPAYFATGLILLAVGSITFQFAEVPYFAMLRQVSTPKTVGRVSGMGWACGYVGGIFLLLACYVLFIAGEGDTRGLLGVSTADGLNIRIVALVAAAWFLVSALPLVFWGPKEQPGTPLRPKEKTSIRASYVALWRDVKRLWREDRRVVSFLLASAVYRDAVAAVFAYGAILAVTAYGIPEDDVLLFGIAANVVSAIGAFAAGWFDDLAGPRRVITYSLIAMIAAALVLAVLSGPVAFWVCGLALTLFVGPVQSASRSLLTRITPPGKEGEAFGLYATSGRAVSFLAPALFALFTGVSGNDKAGIFAIALVAVVGLLLLLRIRGLDGRPSASEVTSS